MASKCRWSYVRQWAYGFVLTAGMFYCYIIYAVIQDMSEKALWVPLLIIAAGKFW